MSAKPGMAWWARPQTMGDVLGQTGGEELFLLGGQGTYGVDLLHSGGLGRLEVMFIYQPALIRRHTFDQVVATHSELDVARKVLDPLILVQRALDERRRDDVLFTVHPSDDRVGEQGAGVGHGEGGGSGTGLGLDDLVTAELDTLDQGLVGLARDSLGDRGLGEEGDDGHSRMSTDDGDVGILGLGPLDFAEEGAASDDVQGGHAEQPLGVKDAVLLEHLGKDGDGGVDGVGDDQDHGAGSVLGGGLGEVSDDRGVGVLSSRCTGAIASMPLASGF